MERIHSVNRELHGLLQQKQKQLDELSSDKKDDKHSSQEAIATIKQASLIAWRHIHIYGTYQFLQQDELISWEEVIRDVKL